MLSTPKSSKIYSPFAWLLLSQSIVLFGTGIVFPFYIIFIKEVGADFSSFGIAYGLFLLGSVVSHKVVGDISDVIGRKIFLLINSWGTSIIFLFFPLVTTLTQVYILQLILGVFGAMYKTGEKTIVADIIDPKIRGKYIGTYHGLTSIFSALAVIIGGYLIDLFTISIIFYIGSIVMFVSGFAILKISIHNKDR